MNYPVTIEGREVVLEWSQETAKRFAFRIGEVGGEPTGGQLTNPRTAATALFKVLWALLPPGMLSRYPDPEALFVAVDHEEEAEALFAAVAGIYAERAPTPEKKSTSKKSPSPGLSSASRKRPGTKATQRKRKPT